MFYLKNHVFFHFTPSKQQIFRFSSFFEKHDFKAKPLNKNQVTKHFFSEKFDFG